MLIGGRKRTSAVTVSPPPTLKLLKLVVKFWVP